MILHLLYLTPASQTGAGYAQSDPRASSAGAVDLRPGDAAPAAIYSYTDPGCGLHHHVACPSLRVSGHTFYEDIQRELLLDASGHHLYYRIAHYAYLAPTAGIIFARSLYEAPALKNARLRRQPTRVIAVARLSSAPIT